MSKPILTDAVQVNPVTSVTIPAGKVGLWTGSSGQPTWRNQDGTDTTLGNGSGGLPDQSGAAGKFLNSDGSSASWQQITQDMIAPAFGVTLSGPAATIEVGGNISNPQFGTTHTQAPVTATLHDNVDTQSISPATLTALGYGGAANTFAARSYGTAQGDFTSIGASVSWLLSATNAAGVTSTATRTTTAIGRAYFGMAVPGTYNSAVANALNGTRTQSGFAQTYAFLAGDGTQKMLMFLPAAWGDPSSFVQGGIPITFTKVASNVSVTNPNAAAILCNAWLAPQFTTSALSVVVS